MARLMLGMYINQTAFRNSHTQFMFRVCTRLIQR